MENLKGFQKKYLRGSAHALNPIVFIGQKGLTDSVVQSTTEALNKHELIKIKFIDFKAKDQKKEIIETIAANANCQLVGMIGHIAVFFRQHSDPEKRKIKLPQQKSIP